jgi:hypothetical protein
MALGAVRRRVAIPGAEVDPGVPAVVDPGLEEDLHAGGAQLGGRALARNPKAIRALDTAPM